ncbi:hypothetical protein MTO96_036598 [Rhipicephalus appendiculatus]
MNHIHYIAFAAVLGACVCTRATKTTRTRPTLQTLRDFLNTTGDIYLYSSSDLNVFNVYQDYESENGDDGVEMNETCTHYHPIMNETDKYVFNTSYLFNSTWHTEKIDVTLGAKKFTNSPYMNESWHSRPLELHLRACDPHVGCCFFTYVVGSTIKCETHVRGENVTLYHKHKGDICRKRTEKHCKDGVYTIYNDNCTAISS